MSNKTNETKKTPVTEQAEGKVTVFGNVTPMKITAFICAVIILGLLIAGAVVLIVDAVKQDAGFSYTDSDMTKYIEISDEKYKNFSVDIAISNNVQANLDNTITKLLNSYKSEKAIGNGVITYDSAAKITAGDEVRLLYIGCTVDEEGKLDFLSGMNNVAGTGALSLKGSEDKLVIGSGSFIAGFESALEGKTLGDYPFITPVASGAIDVTKHIIFVSYTRIEEGKTSSESASYVLINPALGEEAIDATYGEGFYDKVMAVELSAKGVSVEDLSEALGKYNYSSIKVDYAIDLSTASYIDVRFPYDYGNVDLNNKAARFYIFINGMKEFYNDANGEGVYNDAFLVANDNKVLNKIAESYTDLTAKELAEKYPTETYPDLTTDTDRYVQYMKDDLAAKYPTIDSLAEQYKQSIKDELTEKYETALKDAIESSVISTLISNAEVKKWPEKLRDKERREYVQAFEAQYQSFIDMYSGYGYTTTSYPIETYAKSYFGISDGNLWKDEVYKIADEEMKRQMVIYYILQREDVDVSDDVVSAKVEEVIEDYYSEYEDYYFQVNTDEKREDYEGNESELRENVVEMMYDYFEEGYFENEAYYRIAVEYAVENFNITVNTQDPKAE